MAKITGPADLLGPYDAQGERNPFFHDVIIAIAADKTRTWSKDRTQVTIHDITDYDRLTIAKAIGLYVYSQATAYISEYECFIGVPPAAWDSECPIDNHFPKRTWAQLHEGTNYTYRTLEGLNWVFYGAVQPTGLNSAQLAAVAALPGFQLKTNAQYQLILPAPEPI